LIKKKVAGSSLAISHAAKMKMSVQEFQISAGGGGILGGRGRGAGGMAIGLLKLGETTFIPQRRGHWLKI